MNAERQWADTFLSESVPEHLITLEGFRDARRILNPNGMIMTNFYGYLEGDAGKAARSVYKTFLASDFKVEILATPGTEATRNLIFLASDEEKDFMKADYAEPGFEKITNLYDYLVDVHLLETDDVSVLTDEKPQLSKLYAKAAMGWKKSDNAYYRKYFDIK